MYNIRLIYRRELASLFFSPIAYVVMTAWALIMGFFFASAFTRYAALSMQLVRNIEAAQRLNITPTSAILEPVFSIVSVILLFITPLLTMRLFSEEKKEGTIELLLSYPIRDGEILAGKYLAILTMYLVMLGMTFVFPLIVWFFVDVDWGIIASGYLGMLLLGSAFLSLGVFASSITSNQIIAAMITFLILLLSFVLDFISVSVSPVGGAILRHLSLNIHSRNFIFGIIDTKDIVFFLTVNIFCLFLAMRSLELYKWKG